MSELATTEPGTDLEPAHDLSGHVAGAIAAGGDLATSGMTGREKAAVLLVTLGPERAASTFNCLGEGEIESLSLEMTKMGYVDPTQTDAVLQEVAETAMVAGSPRRSA